MADETKFADMIGVLKEAKGWHTLSQSPDYVQYFVLNVKGGGLLEVIGEEQYEKENPEWAKVIREDYAQVLADRAEAQKLREAAEVAGTDAVKFIAGLNEKQRAKLMKLLADEPEAEVVAPPTA